MYILSDEEENPHFERKGAGSRVSQVITNTSCHAIMSIFPTSLCRSWGERRLSGISPRICPVRKYQYH